MTRIPAEESRVLITSDFPGGNIAVDGMDEDMIRLRPDLRDTTTPWFYWYFGVSNAEGRTLTFVFASENIGAFGPAASLDGGQTWKWLGADSVREGSFTHTFNGGNSDVRFSVGMPYLRSNWDEFLRRHAGNSMVEVKTLARSRSGRDVPLLVIENAPHEAAYCVSFTARHHCCEAMASYVLEGIIDEVLSDGADGRWLQENVSFFIVPLMDADGVERGDQGKNRAPHDHNRDYQEEPIYNEVRALKEHLPHWSHGRTLAAFDLHCPALSGAVHESIFFVEPEDRKQAARMDRFSEYWCEAQSGRGITLAFPNKLRHGCGFNSGPQSDKQTHVAWIRRLPGVVLAAGLETAYANALGSEVNPATARELGHTFATALRKWLQESKDF